MCISTGEASRRLSIPLLSRKSKPYAMERKPTFPRHTASLRDTPALKKPSVVRACSGNVESASPQHGPDAILCTHAPCSPVQSSHYAGGMATKFIQHSTEYIQQIEAEIERLQQLRDQVQATIQSEEELESEEPEQQAPRKRAAKKTASKKVAAKKRGRPRASEVAA